MSYDEIIAAGINVNAADNHHVYKYEAKLNFGAEIDTLSLITYFLGDGTFIGLRDFDGKSHISEKYENGTSSGTGKGSGIYYHGADYSSSGGGGWGYGVPATLSNGEQVTVYPVSENFYLIIRGEVRWLKEMFDVELVVFNHSRTDSITDCTATLSLPDGLSLASMKGEQQNLTQTLGDLESASEENPAPSKTVHWYVRGDKAGTYDISASVSGKMMPFEDEFQYDYTAKEPIKVYAGNALHMDITVADSAFYGEDYPVTITLTNVSDRTIYGLSHKITDVIQGKITHYSDGSEVETVYMDKKNVAIVNAEQFKPGDKMVIELSINILFQSEVIEYQKQQLTGFVDDVETLMTMFDSFQKATDIIKSTYDFVDNVSHAVGEAVANVKWDSEEKLRLTNSILTQVRELSGKFAKGDSNTATEIRDQLQSSDCYQKLMECTENPAILAASSISQLEQICKALAAVNKSVPDEPEKEKFNIYTSIKRAIEAIPVRFALQQVSVTTLEGSTTEIPCTIHRTKTGAQYFGVDDIGKYMYNLIIGAIGEIEVPWSIRILGISDPTGYHNAVEEIIAVEEQTRQIAAKTATGNVKVRTWVESKSAPYRSRAAEEPFVLSATAEDAVYKDGVLTFTGDAFINITPVTGENGILHVEMDGKEVKSCEIQVVEKHTCASDTWIDAMLPSDGMDGLRVKKCDICQDIIDMETAAVCEKHSYGAYQLVTEASEENSEIKKRTCSICGHADYAVSEKATAQYAPGDMNGDGIIGSNDALLILKIAANLLTPDGMQEQLADVDGNGTVAASDALLVLKYAAGLIKEFPSAS